MKRKRDIDERPATKRKGQENLEKEK